MFEEYSEPKGYYLRLVCSEIDSRKHRKKRRHTLKNINIEEALEKICLDIDLEGEMFGED